RAPGNTPSRARPGEAAGASASPGPVSEAPSVLSSIRRSLMSVSRILANWFRDGGRRKGAPARKPIRSRLTLEALECRLTPTGNITPSLVGGNLSITDNATTSQLTISQAAANQITLTPDAGTTINGKAGPVTITGVTGNLNVNLGTGNDTLTFDLSQHN